MEPTLALRLGSMVASAISRATAPRPGAHTVADPVRIRRRFALKRDNHVLDEDDFARLIDSMTRRLTDADAEFAALSPDVGREIVSHVAAALGSELSMDDVQAAHLDPNSLRTRLTARSTATASASASGTPFDETARRLYETLLDTCCAHIVEYFTGRPEFTARTLTEHSRNLGELLRPTADSDAADQDFARIYVSDLKRQLDKAEVLGVVEIQPEESSYKLSTAYVNLAVQTALDTSTPESNAPTGHSRTAVSGKSPAEIINGPLETVLQHYSYLLLEGPAGSGKTTLLRRLAVTIIDGNLPPQLAHWHGRIPFLVRIRSLLREGRLNLPTTARLVEEVGYTEGDQPTGWATRLLRSGRAVVLVDGLDELPQEYHAEVLDWLDRWRHNYPDAAYVLTSRPRVLTRRDRHALREAGFGTAELQAMNRANVSDFIARWHHTQGLGWDDSDMRETLRQYGEDLDRLLDSRRDLARLATNPLLCALICALHRGTDRA